MDGRGRKRRSRGNTGWIGTKIQKDLWRKGKKEGGEYGEDGREGRVGAKERKKGEFRRQVENAEKGKEEKVGRDERGRRVGDKLEGNDEKRDEERYARKGTQGSDREVRPGSGGRSGTLITHNLPCRPPRRPAHGTQKASLRLIHKTQLRRRSTLSAGR